MKIAYGEILVSKVPIISFAIALWCWKALSRLIYITYNFIYKYKWPMIIYYLQNVFFGLEWNEYLRKDVLRLIFSVKLLS